MPKPKAKTKERWFQAGAPLNWRKDSSQAQRRRAALSSRRGNLLATGRALNALANVTQDKETQTKARADAKYFFARYKKQQARR